MIKPKKLPRESNQRAYEIVKLLTGEEPSNLMIKKNPHAVELGKLGGLKGGRQEPINSLQRLGESRLGRQRGRDGH